MSPATFFSYLGTKEDVVFGLSAERVAIAEQVIGEAAPGEQPAHVLRRALAEMLPYGWQVSGEIGLGAPSGLTCCVPCQPCRPAARKCEGSYEPSA